MWIKRFLGKIQIFFEDLWDKVTWAFAKFVAWVYRNWDLALILIAATVGIIREALKYRRVKMEDEFRNRRFYDRKTDRWCYANRHLTKRQEDIIETRHLDGETYRSILDDMGLLK